MFGISTHLSFGIFNVNLKVQMLTTAHLKNDIDKFCNSVICNYDLRRIIDCWSDVALSKYCSNFSLVWNSLLVPLNLFLWHCTVMLPDIVILSVFRSSFVLFISSIRSAVCVCVCVCVCYCTIFEPSHTQKWKAWFHKPHVVVSFCLFLLFFLFLVSDAETNILMFFFMSKLHLLYFRIPD